MGRSVTRGLRLLVTIGVMTTTYGTSVNTAMANLSPSDLGVEITPVDQNIGDGDNAVSFTVATNNKIFSLGFGAIDQTAEINFLLATGYQFKVGGTFEAYTGKEVVGDTAFSLEGPQLPFSSEAQISLKNFKKRVTQSGTSNVYICLTSLSQKFSDPAGRPLQIQDSITDALIIDMAKDEICDSFRVYSTSTYSSVNTVADTYSAAVAGINMELGSSRLKRGKLPVTITNGSETAFTGKLSLTGSIKRKYRKLTSQAVTIGARDATTKVSTTGAYTLKLKKRYRTLLRKKRKLKAKLCPTPTGTSTLPDQLCFAFKLRH